LNPEIMDSLELVLMQQGNDWKGNVVFYENRWTDTIALTFLSPSMATYTNSGTSRSQGVETSLSWVPGPWRFNFNASYTTSRSISAHENYKLFPRLIANLGVGYQWVGWNTELSVINRVFSNVDDVAASTFSSPHELPTYFRMDVVVMHDFDLHAQGFLTIINLFNRDNYLPSVLGVENGIPDDPLTLNVGLRYRF